MLRLAIREPFILSSRFAQSLIGEEYGRLSAWEENPTSLVSQRIHVLSLADRKLDSGDEKRQRPASMWILHRDTWNLFFSVLHRTTVSMFDFQLRSSMSNPSQVKRPSLLISAQFMIISRSKNLRFAQNISSELMGQEAR